jgi:hypothetical protein
MLGPVPANSRASQAPPKRSVVMDGTRVGLRYGALAGLLAVAANWAAVAPLGHSKVIEHVALLLLHVVVSAVGLLILAAVVGTPFLLAGLAFRRRRKAAARWLVSAVIGLPLAVAGAVTGEQIRHRAFERLAERSAPLVKAIGTCEQERGRPPSTLEELAPAFLSAVPLFCGQRRATV